MVRDIKEKLCIVVQELGGPDEEYKRNREGLKDLDKPAKYVLPDNTEITITEEKFIATELLFNPEKIGNTSIGIQDMLISSIKKADIELRSILVEDIFISGAGSKFTGFPTRILNEVKRTNFENVPVMLKINNR